MQTSEESFFENAIERGNEKASAHVAEVQMQIRREDTSGVFYVEIDAKDIVWKNISATDSIAKKHGKVFG